MIDIEVEGEQYVVDKLDARTQFHVVRRLAPVMTAWQQSDEDDMVANVATAMSAMSDADSNYVIDACLSKVKKRQGANVLANVITPGGHFMFDGMSMGAMISLSMAVLKQSKLPDFFPIEPSNSGGEGAALHS